MKKLWQTISYFNYKIKAKSRYKIHSPFVYDLIDKVFRDKTSYQDYRKLNHTRQRYLRRTDRIDTMDFGEAAGKKEYVSVVTTVGKVVKQRTHGRKRLELLYRMAKYFKPETILEFGTAAGISAIYFATGSPESRVVTMEGCMGLSSVARKSFKKRKLNVEVEVGDFDASLEHVLPNMKQLDMVYFDGNHRKEPTLRYFEKCVQLSNENSVFMFDDIHWSYGMQQAWNTIKKDKRVSLTIDLYWVGLVFFRKGVEKQNFVIKY